MLCVKVERTLPFVQEVAIFARKMALVLVDQPDWFQQPCG